MNQPYHALSKSVAAILDESGQRRTGVPTMFVAAPVRDSNFQVMAVLAMRIPPQNEFTHILQLGRIGDSGETYAFNRQGLMISNSRFDEDLILLGLIPDVEDAKSLLSIQIRDPTGQHEGRLSARHPKIRTTAYQDGRIRDPWKLDCRRGRIQRLSRGTGRGGLVVVARIWFRRRDRTGVWQRHTDP